MLPLDIISFVMVSCDWALVVHVFLRTFLMGNKLDIALLHHLGCRKSKVLWPVTFPELLDRFVVLSLSLDLELTNRVAFYSCCTVFNKVPPGVRRIAVNWLSCHCLAISCNNSQLFHSDGLIGCDDIKHHLLQHDVLLIVCCLPSSYSISKTSTCANEGTYPIINWIKGNNNFGIHCLHCATIRMPGNVRSISRQLYDAVIIEGNSIGEPH